MEFYGYVFTFFLGLILGFIFGFLYLRTKIEPEVRKTLEEIKKEQGATSAPHFESMNTGDIFSVSYQAWKITDIETSYDPALAEHKLRVTARSVGVGL